MSAASAVTVTGLASLLDSQERNRLIVTYLPLVRMIAVRVMRRYPSTLELEDLVNVGTLGLIESLDRYEADRGVPLKGYAELRVRGAMVDAIRKTDWVPREVRRRTHRVDDARRSLRQRLGREPDRIELSAALEMSPDALDSLMGTIAPRRVVSLDAPSTDDGRGTVADTVADRTALVLDKWIEGEHMGALDDAISNLPEDEQRVTIMYYQRGMKYREIGAVMGVCESRVCQLRTKALDRLRKRVLLRTDGADGACAAS
jgi:RNA polymerase sigma factor for flagellar operon FliA